MPDLIKHLAASFPVVPGKSQIRSTLAGGVIFPFYHAVSDTPLQHLRHAYPIRSVREFRSDLEFLLKHFQPVSMEQVLKHPGKTGSASPRMVLSFDDGLIQCHEIILPLLQQMGIPAVFFLNNDFIDNRGLFYRYKVSLLLEWLPLTGHREKKEAAELLQCRPDQLPHMIRKISYAERNRTDRIAELWGFSFAGYQREHPVYMSSVQVGDLLDRGFEVGAHGTDHPRFALMPEKEALEQVRRSVDDIQDRFRVSYRYFAFPFTDHGVSDETIGRLFEMQVIDAGFGTAGLKEDRWERYFQRIPMEFGSYSGKQLIKGELLRRFVRKKTGMDRVDRKYDPGNSFRVNTLVIGAGRSGTTTICDVLEQHPDVCYSVVKEVYYFSIPGLYRRGERYFHSFFEHCTGRPVVATADTYLLIDYEAIRRIHAYNPEMKIIVMVRDPVERASSSYHYSVNYGHHRPYRSFTDSMEAEAAIAEEPDVVKRNNLGHFYTGLYCRHLDRWLEVFDRSRILVLPTARLKEDPGAIVSALFDFLELPQAQIDPGRLNVHAVPRSRALEQTLLNRESLLRRAVRNFTPAFVKNRVIRSGLIEKLFTMNRKVTPVPQMSGEERRKAAAFFREDMDRLEKDYQVRGVWKSDET